MHRRKLYTRVLEAGNYNSRNFTDLRLGTFRAEQTRYAAIQIHTFVATALSVNAPISVYRKSPSPGATYTVILPRVEALACFAS